MSAALIAQLQAQRDTWCVVRPAGDGLLELAIKLRRPPEAELPDYRPTDGKALHHLLAEAVCRTAVDWRGFTEADLLGASVGSSDAVAFSAELWAEVVRDHADWLNACASHLMERINAHMQARAEQRKN